MSVLKRSLRFVAAGAMTVTISACYGGGVCNDCGEPPESVAVTGGNAVILGTDLQLTATATYADASTADVTAYAFWDSDNEAVATVSAGLVTGVNAGSALISADSGGVIGSVTVTVGTSASISFRESRIEPQASDEWEASEAEGRASESDPGDLETSAYGDDGPG